MYVSYYYLCSTDNENDLCRKAGSESAGKASGFL